MFIYWYKFQYKNYNLHLLKENIRIFPVQAPGILNGFRERLKFYSIINPKNVN
jgi:hypothetical protein